MKRVNAVQPLRRVLVAYVIVGVGLSIGLEILTPYKHAPFLAWLMLPLLALAAELMPVQLSRNGLRIAFSLPYLAGMAVAVGASGALLTDLAVTLVAAAIVARKKQDGIAPFWILLNMAVSAISASLAGLVFALCLQKGGFQGVTTVSALVFTIIYGTVNFLLISYVDSLTSKHPLSQRLQSTARLGAQGILLYCLLSVAVAVLVYKRLYVPVAFTLLPIFVLRRVLKLRSRMFEHYYETVTALTLMLQRAHPYTHGHIERVARISEEVCYRLGLSSRRAQLVREASVLHDIGKIAIDEEILDKPAKLTDEEFLHVKQHSVLGAQILAPVESLREIVPWIRHHHERPDGRGYPDGLQDIEIPIESKIIAVVDAFDAMTGGDAPSDRRPYREPMSVLQAVEELERCSGTQFDTRVVQAFKQVLASGVG